ncbi:hypothetical protein [Tessaracoccus antarcticus]|uniref:Uncharacterized protein n=1 Tax=Tessaracoccus antarcticus TaxID=2479848 RepID=A0A3M0GKN6_9ACTN|nr:hypothetical protein [Tessaracoccus antarcticus]RMB57866.1 hypothetical protein EAX62_15555 [Tessaracoccus antarcticus]
MSTITTLLTALLTPPATRRRDERGLSQSVENAVLLGGAVAIATLVIFVITAYVRANLPT